MKQIRYGTFETNSSSTHSLIMCSGEDYKKLCTGELMIDRWKEKIVSVDDVVKEIRTYIEKYGRVGTLDSNSSDKEIHDSVVNRDIDFDCVTLDEYFDNDFLDSFEQEYTTPNGEKVVAFGLYGHD